MSSPVFVAILVASSHLRRLFEGHASCQAPHGFNLGSALKAPYWPISCPYSRHWYDLDRLARAGISEAAVRDRTLAAEVAQHKEDFWRAMDADEQPIDYLHALSGNLQLVPTDAARQALESD